LKDFLKLKSNTSLVFRECVLWYNFHIDWKRACEDLNEIEKLLFSLMKNIWSLLVLECLVKLLQRHWQIG